MPNEQRRQIPLDIEAQPGHHTDVSQVNPRVLRRITAMAFRHRGRMALAIAATISAAVFQLFVPQFLGRAVDQAQGLLADATEATAQTAAGQALLTTALLLLGASVLRGLCTMTQIQHSGPAKLLAKDDLAISVNTVELDDGQ